jgi:hypothetical protein
MTDNIIRDYILYFKTCPGVKTPRHFKVGIAQLATARSRLATYQNAVGPVWEESFIRVWIGDENQIRLAEKNFKRFFKDKISSAEAGLSEWICGIDLKELLAYIKELREEHFLKFIDAPKEFLPLTMPLCEDLAEWYSSQPKEVD